MHKMSLPSDKNPEKVNTTAEQRVRKIFGDLEQNASLLKTGVKEGNLAELVKLTSDRVAIIESLREFAEAKVFPGNSEVREEMYIVLKNIENDVNEAAGGIRTRLSALMKELGNIKGARRIAAYAAMSQTLRHAVRHPAHPISMISERDKIRGGNDGY